MANSSVGGNITAQTAIASVPASSASDMPVHTWSSLSVGLQQHSLSDMSWYARRSAYASSVGAFASADRTLAASQSAPRKKNGMTIEDTYYQWLQSNNWAHGGGADNLSEAEIRALWDALCAGNEDFALTYTYEDFFNWLLSKQSDETFKWRLPIGDSVPFLLLLCISYAIILYTKQQKNKWVL